MKIDLSISAKKYSEKLQKDLHKMCQFADKRDFENISFNISEWNTLILIKLNNSKE